MATVCMLAHHPDISGADGLKVYLNSIQYPVYVSPKIDGVRALTSRIGVRSRDGKPVPNPSVRSLLKKLPIGIDGEIICGNSFTETSGTFRHMERIPSSLTYFVFDIVRPSWTFQQRKDELESIFEAGVPEGLILVPHHLCTRIEDVIHYFKKYTTMPYPYGEGICLRRAESKYKIGRSTGAELTALKSQELFEAVVVGTEELIHRQSPNDLIGLS